MNKILPQESIDRENRHHIPPLISPPISLIRQISRIILLVSFISLIGLIILSIWHTRSVGYKSLENILPQLVLLFSLLFFPIAAWVINCLKNERFVYYGILLIISIMIYAGGLYVYNGSESFTIAILAGFLLCFFFLFYRLPLSVYGFSFLFIVICFCWQIVPVAVIILIYGDMPLISYSFLICYSFLLVFVIAGLISFAYLPRDMEWKRYFSSYRSRSSLFHTSQKGFTLIELLIVVAVLGIVCVGIFQSWASIVRTHHELQVRAHATEILNSEMESVMGTLELPSLSSESHELPISLKEFVTPFRFDGDLLVEQSESAGLYKVTVRLWQDIDASNRRIFRLIGYRRGKAGATP